MKEVKAPNEFVRTKTIVFFAGSIEMGIAEPWQLKLATALRDMDVTVLNPRRDDWDSSWKQTKDNPQFREQVEWELEGQEAADVIALYFDPATHSPISLLELGLFGKGPGKMVVLCPEGFYRKGNVDIVCERYGIEQAGEWDEFVARVRTAIENSTSHKLAGVWE